MELAAVFGQHLLERFPWCCILENWILFMRSRKAAANDVAVPADVNVMAGSTRSPGSRNVVPYTNSATVAPMSSFTSFLIPSSTSGRATVHVVS